MNEQYTTYEVERDVSVVNALTIEEMNASGLKLEDIQNEDTQND